MRSITPLAWKNLTHDLRRLAVAVSGVAFAVILIFMEVGFLNALLESTVQILRRMKGEVLLVSTAQYALIAGERFDLRRLQQAREATGVEAVSPVYLETTTALLRVPGQRGYPIRVVAVQDTDDVLDIPQMERLRSELKAPAAALADVASRPKYQIPGSPEQPYRAELNGKDLQLVGRFHLGVDFATDGNLLMTAANFASFFPFRAGGEDPLSRVDIGVVRLAPGADPERVATQLNRILPADVRAHTTDALVEREMQFWRTNAPLGYIFMVGAVMGFVVGVVICYQIIYADISDHFREFATLKAMGYRNSYFVSLVLGQSFYLAVLGFLPGMLFSWATYNVLTYVTGLTMQFTWPLALSLFGVTTAMCLASGLLAVSKLLTVDPAELF